ncbi:hypothetical protein [Nonomuraea soli]|uniref:Polysaccharide deacetylase n=1 Tax=Nonomuraea soli TaxID=1032476 RepID=A0A7W0HRL3_9ACTN|nr:hypothetical protein [Nonomuraea soli]MBA2893065.1 hypothetical protein [Nonomuraea soli]
MFERCRLRDGERPPQFVVISFDGAGVDDQGWFPVFRETAERNNAFLTFFLSGVYLLPSDRKELYRPPGRRPGSSDIGFQRPGRIDEQAEELAAAYTAGHEIGTHFNGHFCGSDGVRSWSAGDWRDEIEQFHTIVENWRANSGRDHRPDLPFRIRDVVKGGRTPCLEGRREAMFRAFKQYGWRYDASGTGTVSWPHRRAGLWQFPLPSIRMPGSGRMVLAMDYNFFTLHSGAKSGRPHEWNRWERQTTEAYLRAIEGSLDGDRAPVFIGNHFESWNDGIYMRALITVMDEACRRDEVRCVSFEQLADWLDAQSPRTLTRLRQQM